MPQVSVLESILNTVYTVDLNCFYRTIPCDVDRTAASANSKITSMKFSIFRELKLALQSRSILPSVSKGDTVYL